MALATAIRAAHDPTYNGWANKPTWLVHLWLSNDPQLYADSVEVVGRHQDGHHTPWCDQLDEHTTHHPDDWLRSYVEAYLQDGEGIAPRGLGWDLLSSVLSLVEWPEIAEAFAPEPSCPAGGEPIDCHPEGCDDTR